MSPTDFERALDRAVAILTDNLRSSDLYHDPDGFEQHVQDMLRVAARDTGFKVSPTWHPSAFPDIRVNGYGVEVKYTKSDSWQATGNSIFEKMRDSDVSSIYVVMGKTGGEPEVRWGRYEEVITRVRVSNSPRFVLELGGEPESLLFDNLSVSYDEFARLSDADKMQHVREHSRQRLAEGEALWWLDADHTLPVAVKVYRTLPEAEKRIYRAEATLLCPEVVKPGYRRGKYDNAGLYLITQHGVFAPQLRDLFSAGSVGAKDGKRGHKYIIDAIRDIEVEMLDAAQYLDSRLIEEHWGFSCEPDERIGEWLRLADGYATDWIPSDELFLC